MNLKYYEEITKLNCSLSRFSERNRTAFRWVIDTIDHPNNFLPRAIIVGRSSCGDWGLSFFDTLQQSEERLLHIIRDKPRLSKKLGNHIAEGLLTATDGISEDCNEEGHFNLHEYEGCDLKSKFNIVKKVA